MKTLYAPDPIRYPGMKAAELRDSLLLASLFQDDVLTLCYSDVDRAVVGGVIPRSRPIALEAAVEIRASSFTERRELGVLNIGGKGSISVDGQMYMLDYQDILYIGRGKKQITFATAEPDHPACFYLLSYPAHREYPTTLMCKSDAQQAKLGSADQANIRTIYKYIHPGGIPSCQLVMGVTELAPGSVWNTMPAHTHPRRSEVYLYFEMTPEARVFHLMGMAGETRHLVVADRQAVVSPAWSIHSGVGTARYCFCWGMGGENQEFGDMDPVAMDDLK